MRGTWWVPACMALSLAVPAGAQEVVDLPARDVELELEPTEVFRVGGAMAEAEWEIFGDLPGSGAVAFDGAGNLYVFDRDNFRVVVVGPDGGFIRQFGEEGEGPGEWRLPSGMAVFPDGRVVIADLGHRAFLLYGPEGELERTVSMRTEGGMIAVGRMYPDRRGGAIYTADGAGGVRVRMSAGGGASADEPGRPVERWSLGGEETSAETVFTAWEAPREEPETTSTMSGGGVSFSFAGSAPRAFEPSVRMAALPRGRLALVDSTAWSVKLVSPEGELTRVLRRPLRPQPVTPAVEERERELRLEAIDSGEQQMRLRIMGPGGQVPISQEQIREMQRNRVAQLEFFHHIPVVDRVSATWDGTLWVERTPEAWWEAGPVDVVRPDGEYVGTIPSDGVEVPIAFGPGGLAAWMERDDFDVATIRVARLPARVR